MATVRPFRFGIFAENANSHEALLTTAHRAEEAGYAIFLIRDHFIAEPFGHQLAPLTALATVASATKRLRVGSLVLANDYRHPVLLAKEAATLDVLSGGRFELGLGAGFLRSEYEQAGMSFDPVGVRVGRLEEALQVLKGLFGDEPFTYAGRHYKLTDFDSFPKPFQRPHPPILVVASGRRMLSIAAREADIIGFQTVSTASGTVTQDPEAYMAATVNEKVELVRQVAGARFGEIELSTTASVVITDNRQEEAERFVRDLGWNGVSTEQVLEMPSVFIGSVDQIVEEMQTRRERYGFSYYVVLDQIMEKVGPIVDCIAGK